MTAAIEHDRADRAPSAAGAKRANPPGRRIEAIESSPERLVLALRAGGPRTLGVGCMALMWCGIGAVFTVGLFVHPLGPGMMLAPVLLLLGAVGGAFAVAWARMRFTRTYLLLEPDRLAVQRVLLGRRRVSELSLGPAARAELVEHYEETGSPVYAVVVYGTERTERFGTALSQREKEWLRQAINDFLGAPPLSLEQWPAVPVLEDVPPLSPGRLPADSLVEVDEATPERLRFSLPTFPPGRIRSRIEWVRRGVSAVSLVIALGALVRLLWANQADWTPLVVIGAAMAGDFITDFAVGRLLRARLAVDLTRDRLWCRLHCSPWFRHEHAWPTAEIVAVVAGETVQEGRRPDGGRGFHQNAFPSCIVKTRTLPIPLTTYHDRMTVRQVAGVVRHQLETMGVRLPEPAPPLPPPLREPLDVPHNPV